MISIRVFPRDTVVYELALSTASGFAAVEPLCSCMIIVSKLIGNSSIVSAMFKRRA